MQPEFWQDDLDRLAVLCATHHVRGELGRAALHPTTSELVDRYAHSQQWRTRGADLWPSFSGAPSYVNLHFERSIMWHGVPAWHELVNGPAPTRRACSPTPSGGPGPVPNGMPAPTRWYRSGGRGRSSSTTANGSCTVRPAARSKSTRHARGLHLSDALADWLLDNGLGSSMRTKEQPLEDDAVVELVRDPHTVTGVSDAGAHIQMFNGAGNPAFMLARYVRDTGVLSIEEMVHSVTGKHAGCFGLADRGVVEAGRPPTWSSSRSTSSGSDPTSGSTTSRAARGATPGDRAASGPRSSTACRPSSTVGPPAPGRAPSSPWARRLATTPEKSAGDPPLGLGRNARRSGLSQPQPVAGDPVGEPPSAAPGSGAPRRRRAPPRCAADRPEPPRRAPERPPTAGRPGSGAPGGRSTPSGRRALAGFSDGAWPVFSGRAGTGARRRAVEVLVGFLIAAVVTAALSPTVGNSSFSKAAVYLAVVAVTGAFLGALTAGVVAFFEILGLWYVFYAPDYSFGGRTADDVWGLALTAVTAVVIVVVVARLEQASRSARESERRLAGLLRIALALTSVRTRAELRQVLTDDFRTVTGASTVAVVEPAGDRTSWGLTVGYEGDLDPGWLGRVSAGSPGQRAMQTGEAVYLPTVDSLVQDWPHLGDVIRALGETARAALPLPFEESGRGAVTIGWRDAPQFDARDRELLEALAAMLASAIARLRRSERASEAGYAQVLEAMLDGVGVYRAIRDPVGEIMDFEVRFLNQRTDTGAARGAAYEGRSVRDLYPDADATGLFDAMVAVLGTGTPFVRDPFELGPAAGATARPVAISATRQDDETVVLVVRDVSERERAQRDRELAIAEAARRQAVVDELQRAFLPESLPEVESHGISARYVAAEPDAPVGGDWYDAFMTPAGALIVAVGDVAGHGVTASGLMSLVRSAIRAYANENWSPAEILDRADRLVGTVDGFATCWLASYDPASGAYTWATAGHPPPVVVAGAGTRLLTGAPDPPLGLVTSTRTDRRDTLEPGQALVAYSDGLVERRGEPLTDGFQRLVTVATGLAPGDDELPDRLIAGMPQGRRRARRPLRPRAATRLSPGAPRIRGRRCRWGVRGSGDPG